VTVGELTEARYAGHVLGAQLSEAAQAVGMGDATADYAEGPSPGPSHALEETAAVNAIVVVVVQELILYLWGHRLSGHRFSLHFGHTKCQCYSSSPFPANVLEIGRASCRERV